MEFFYSKTHKNILILSADGGLNKQNAEQFVGELQQLVDAGARKLIVDCTQLRYISSYGMGILLRLHKRVAEKGGEIKLAAIDNPVVRALRLVKLDTVFEIYDNVDAAQANFDSTAN